MSDRYTKMKVAELKEELQRRGLKTSGSKDILIERLKEKESEGESAKDSPSSSESEEEGDVKLPEDIKTMKVSELKAALKERGLPASGNKASLLERLQAHLNGEEPPAQEKKTPKRKTTEESKTSRKKKKNDDSDDEDPIPLSSSSSIISDDFTLPPKPANEIKIVTWNVAGFAGVMKKGFSGYMKSESPDIICLNETKIKSLPADQFPGYHVFLNPAEKAGYSGVGLLTKIKPINITMGIGIKEHDTEGRCITAEYEQFYLIATYIPNSGAKGEDGWPKDLDYRMQWDVAFQDYLHKLDKIKPIIWCGDLNVAHEEIDLSNPKTSKKLAGFTPKERESFDKFLKSGFVDVHRRFNPAKTGCFSFWSYRSKNARSNNIGWRLDYFIVSDRLLHSVTQSYFRTSVTGSDHCPICIHYKLG